MHQNITTTESESTFEEDLYSLMKFLHPSLTVRTFSVACLNRSAGYWSSVLAQKIPLPSTALLDLSDYLEVQKIVHSDKFTKVKVITDIQEMIEDEILRRFQETNQISKEGWDRLSESIRQESTGEKYGYYGMMPFISTRY